MVRGWIAVCVLAGALGASAGCGGAAGPRYDLTPVLLVHGSGMSSRSWSGLVEHLVESGYPPAYVAAVDIEPPDMANVRAAEDVIAPAVEELLTAAAEAARAAGARTPPPARIDLVGHSMGAFSSRWYAARIAPDRVRTWIGLAGANHGTDALAEYPGDGNDEMVPAFAPGPEQSAVQFALNGTVAEPRDETPFGLGTDARPGVESVAPDGARSILYVTLRLDPDRWIRPASSAVLDGCGGGPLPTHEGLDQTSPGNFLVRGETDHDHLMDAPAVREFVVILLTHRRD